MCPGLLLALGVTVTVLGIFLALTVWNMLGTSSKHVTIVVLGDIGRSPRMTYHAVSFANQGYTVDFVGYGGSLPHEAFRSSPQIQQHIMTEPPCFINKLPTLLRYAVKVLWQSSVLLSTLVTTRKSSHLLLQNPPAIPTLAVAWLFCFYRDTYLLVDWHNYGYTLLGLTLGPNHLLVRFSKWYEHWFGQCAVRSICVTDAMRDDLAQNWNIRAYTMYDRPPEMFKEYNLETRHNLFLKLSQEYDVFKSRTQDMSNESTVFTQVTIDGDVELRSDRPVLLVSSTSWTEDEDFSILLSALEDYEIAVSKEKNLPHVICVITGRGPLKEYYEGIIEKKQLKHIKFCTPWLLAEDYPKLLGSADLGVCLHKSSSGLDLPMKVVDMFGCGLPVCAINFKCLPELVKHEENGLIFNTEKELAKQLQDLLHQFPEGCSRLKTFRRNLLTFQKNRWNDSWQRTVLPLVKGREVLPLE